MKEEKKTSKGWRVGDRIAYQYLWGPPSGAVILEIDTRVKGKDMCRLRFDDDSSGWHDVGDSSSLGWRRIRSKKITLKEKSK